MENSNEAPSSVTYSITSKDGFNILFTVRDDSGTKLLEKMALVEPDLLKRGYKPQVRQTFGSQKPPAEIVPDIKCPLCKSNLVFAKKADGTKFIKCSTNKWNPMTKKAEGCTYIDWMNKPDDRDMGVPEDYNYDK